jgi:hypothetical protein
MMGSRARLDRGVAVKMRESAVRAALVLGAVAVLALGCGRAEPAAPAPPPASVVKAPDPDRSAVPAAPQGKPMLTITGRIGVTNGDRALRLDQAELDRFGLLEMSVNDPWAKQRIALQGTWLRDLVDMARPDTGATSLHLVALDDYQVDLTLADVRDQPVFLATRTGDGTVLPIEDGGPTRVVFADGLADRFSPDMWIWNIETIEVR